MSPAQFNELQRQADVIEKAAEYEKKLKEYRSNGLKLILTEAEKDTFIRKAEKESWSELYMIHKANSGYVTDNQYYYVYFDKKVLENDMFLTHIFTIGSSYGVKFVHNK